jgi:hypothetical protein
MLIYLDDFRKTRFGVAQREIGSATLKNGTYGAEVMNSGWNPAVLYAINTPAQSTISPDLPHDLASIDIEAFMSRVYALATQV